MAVQIRIKPDRVVWVTDEKKAARLVKEGRAEYIGSPSQPKASPKPNVKTTSTKPQKKRGGR